MIARHPIVELQRRFSAAVLEMEQAWVIYRTAREDAEALKNYIRTLTRCQRLKDSIFRLMTARRELRRAA